MALFDSEFLKKLEYLSLVSRRVFRGQLLAQRRTKQLGGGIEFADHREYSAGDDLRYLDWNIYARHDELLLKRFQEEEDLHVYLFLDCSRSMALGSKFALARQITAALAHIALADLDRISIIAAADRIVDVLPLTRGKERILTVLQFLESLDCDGRQTDFRRVITGFVHRQQRTGLAIVVSDLFDPGGFEGGIDLLRHRRYEPHLVQLHDPREANPDLLGDVELLDMETGDLRKVTVTERNLRQYRKLFQDFLTSVETYCLRYGIGCTRSTTETEFDELILRMMRMAGAVQ